MFTIQQRDRQTDGQNDDGNDSACMLAHAKRAVNRLAGHYMGMVEEEKRKTRVGLIGFFSRIIDLQSTIPRGINDKTLV